MSSKDREETFKKQKPLFVLETFFNGEKLCDRALNLVGNNNFLLDSGAFSYMNGKEITKQELDVFVDKYISYIKSRDIKYYMEMDVDVIFGIKQVEKWRHKIEISTGKKCIPVWHLNRGIEYWKKMCNEYNYVAIGGLVTGMKKQNYPLIKKMINYANSKGVKVHGLGFTKTKILREFKFYSVDSSSWSLSAVRGNQIHHFKDGVIEQRQIDKKDKINYKTNGSLLASHNMKEWIKYQIYMIGVK
ncbi:hypothetical protein [Peptostreptococcus sp. D1]|uniref:hypothetical protein n=1 Tax=Peptostreptococcus sp. D1 TaxID=72304 RepID=UPI0015A53BA1|nr:hypothetical protein [Peptostreptococcus sp. D1]